MRQPNATLNNDNPDDFVEEAMIHNDSNNDYGITSSNSSSSRIFPVVVVQIFGTCKAWWVQCITIAICAVLTYSYNNIDAGNTPPPSSLSTTATATITTTTNVQIAIMTIITLVGASPFRNTHLIAASIGTFVGGQNIIGSSRNSGLDETEFHFKNYVWLLILATIVGLIWCFVITNSKLKILDGYAGRLGTTTFIGMNATMLIIFGPLGIIDWNRYYYGLYHIVHAAEAEDASSSSSSSSLLASAWTWTEEVEVAIGYALAVLWLGCIAGATRIYHQRYVQKWIKDSTSLSLVSPPKLQQPEPLNNVLIPVLWALMSMLIVNSTNYRHAFGLYNGFAVGSYVAMASLQKIPTVTRFITVSFVAACWGLALTPFFVGFAGKSGFTSMCGHVTHALLEKLIKRIRIIRWQKKRQQQQQDDKEQLRAHTNNRMLELVAEHSNSLPEQDPADGRHQQHPKTDFQLYHSHKPSKKKELILVTKQQRRQQQRLHHQNQQEHQNDLSSQEQEQGALLHHRAWSATTNVDSANDGDVWEHPLDS